MSTQWTLFLDDLRNPTWDLGDEVRIARNCDEAVKITTELGLPECVSFDHDLGPHQMSAMSFMWWLVEGHMDGKHDLNEIKQIIIHSANPVGAENLRGLWDGFASTELDSGVRASLRPR